jgi:hypothetical protein
VIPASHTAGVYAGARKPAALVLQELAGERIGTSHEVKYSRTPNAYTIRPILCLVVLMANGIKMGTRMTSQRVTFSPVASSHGIRLADW